MLKMPLRWVFSHISGLVASFFGTGENFLWQEDVFRDMLWFSFRTQWTIGELWWSCNSKKEKQHFRCLVYWLSKQYCNQIFFQKNKNSNRPKGNIFCKNFQTSWTIHAFVHPSSSQYESPFTPNMNRLKGWERIFGSCALFMRIAVVLAGPCECVCELRVHGLTHLPVICIEEWANWTWVLVVLNCRRQLVHCWKPQWLHCSEGTFSLCFSSGPQASQDSFRTLTTRGQKCHQKNTTKGWFKEKKTTAEWRQEGWRQ